MTTLEAAGILTLLAAALYALYETAALLEEALARHQHRSPRIITISEIVRGWERKHRIPFLIAVAVWLLFGIWFAVHIIFKCCP